MKVKITGNANIERIKEGKEGLIIKSHWYTELWRKGECIDKWDQHNRVPNEFMDHVLDVALSGGTQYSTWYVGLISDNTLTPLSTWIYATPSFTEATSYSGERKQWQDAGPSSRSITNTANKASFTLNGNDTSLSGYFLTNISTAGDTAAANGILGPISAFSEGSKTSLENGDIMKVWAQIDISDAGLG